jgi:hypothetical protein
MGDKPNYMDDVTVQEYEDNEDATAQEQYNTDVEIYKYCNSFLNKTWPEQQEIFKNCEEKKNIEEKKVNPLTEKIRSILYSLDLPSYDNIYIYQLELVIEYGKYMIHQYTITPCLICIPVRMTS